MALAPAGPVGGNASSTITSVAFHLIRFTAFSTFSQGEEAFIAMRFHHAWLISLIIAISHSRFSHPTIACSAASQFNPTGVHVRNRFFGTFLTQESTVSPRSPSFLPSCIRVKHRLHKGQRAQSRERWRFAKQIQPDLDCGKKEVQWEGAVRQALPNGLGYFYRGTPAGFTT